MGGEGIFDDAVVVVRRPGRNVNGDEDGGGKRRDKESVVHR